MTELISRQHLLNEIFELKKEIESLKGEVKEEVELVDQSMLAEIFVDVLENIIFIDTKYADDGETTVRGDCAIYANRVLTELYESGWKKEDDKLSDL